MNQSCERLIIFLIKISNQNPIFEKLAPNCYQYIKGSFRNIDRDNVILQLDISDYIQHYIYFGFKDLSNAYLLSLVKKNDTVIDIGSNIGYTALRLSRIVGKDGIIHSFEPDTLNYQKFIKNVSLNQCSNIVINKFGLGEKEAVVKLFVNTDTNRGGNRINENAKENFEEIKIITLDEYVANNKLTKINLIKIDVEGYELKVLKGSVNTLIKFKPDLFIEFDHNNLLAQNDSAVDLISYLVSLSYKIIDTVTGKEINERNVQSFLNIHTDIVCKVVND